MTKQMNTKYPGDLMRGYAVYVTNAEPLDDLKKLWVVNTFWDDMNLQELRGGAGMHNAWIAEQMICKTGVATRNANETKDTQTRTFDQVVHEFAHGIHERTGVDQQFETIYPGDSQAVETFAWDVQHYFGVGGGAPARLPSPKPRKDLINDLFKGQATFDCATLYR